MSTEKKGIAILGSTGELGKKALQILKRFPDEYKVEVLTAKENKDLLIAQALEFKPNVVVIEDESLRDAIDEVLWQEDIKTYAGKEAMFQVTEMNEVNVVFNAIDGESGIKPSEMAINSGKTLVLGNSSTLQMKGSDIAQLAFQKGVNIFPVDILHTSIFQALVGDFDNTIAKIDICLPENYEDHKGYWDGKLTEVEYLFGIKKEKMCTYIHKENKVQSMIHFQDGTCKIQLNITQEQAIAYALFYPNRMLNQTECSIAELANMSFVPVN